MPSRIEVLEAENHELRAQLEAARAETRASELMAVAFQTVADPVFMKDREHRWTLVNRAFCEFVGVSEQELLGHKDADFFPPEQVAVFLEMDEKVFRTGEINVNEELITSAAGSTFVLSTKKTLAWDSSGQPMLVGIIRDITELRRSQDEAQARRQAELVAEQANRSKSQFLTNMSHELRTPLNGIIGYTELLREELEHEVQPEHLEALDCVLGASAHLLSMIDSILDLSRIEAGHIPMQVETLALRPVVDEVVATTSRLAVDAGVTLEVDVPAELEVRVDRRAITQIVMNLVANALKFTRDGTVEVSAAEIDGAVELSVRDTGMGIAPDHLPRLFDKFWQAGAPSQGSGLGLAITRTLCQQLGGSIRVTSNLGEGSCFTVTLPR